MKGEMRMSVKQDRTYARTAQDLERKYKFGQTFADMLGLVNENREKVDKVESDVKSATTLMRDTEKLVFEVIENGVDKVETKTGYRLDHDGLTISKSGEEMENVIDNTGMYVNRGDENILTANHKGVDAVNLRAKTYLIIGEGDGRSRFEDYGTNRTGCYWIGG
jgi:hypothetical protein